MVRVALWRERQDGIEGINHAEACLGDACYTISDIDTTFRLRVHRGSAHDRHPRAERCLLGFSDDGWMSCGTMDACKEVSGELDHLDRDEHLVYRPLSL